MVIIVAIVLAFAMTSSLSGIGSGNGHGVAFADAAGIRVVGYYPSWAVYNGQYLVTDIPLNSLTHINYAFANIANNQIAIGDLWADTQYPYAGTTAATVLNGNFGALVRMKAANPQIKTSISIGGWTWSSQFSGMASSAATRAVFVQSVIEFIKNYQFDGVDIDWEYPVAGGMGGNGQSPDDGANFLALMQLFRQQLTALAASYGDGRYYYLSFAASANPNVYKYLDLKTLSSIVDWVTIMTYDYHGTWETMTGFNSPLYADSLNPAPDTVTHDQFNVDWAVQNFVALGMARSKVHLGMAFYGRFWQGVTAGSTNGLYQPASATAPMGSFGQEGMLNFWHIQDNYIGKLGMVQYWNNQAKLPFLYNGNFFITYDNEQSIALKCQYALSNAIGGVTIWEMSADLHGTLASVVHLTVFTNSSTTPVTPTPSTPAASSTGSSGGKSSSSSTGIKSSSSSSTGTKSSSSSSSSTGTKSSSSSTGTKSSSSSSSTAHASSTGTSGTTGSSTAPASTAGSNSNVINGWTVGPWNDCSKSCGGGTQTRVVFCSNETTAPVVPVPVPASSSDPTASSSTGSSSGGLTCDGTFSSEFWCQGCSLARCVVGKTSPVISSCWAGTVCNGGRCDWGTCQTSSARHRVFSRAIGFQAESVRAVSKVAAAGSTSAAGSSCTSSPPPTSQSCNPQSCPPTNTSWYTTPFADCPAPCGGSQQKRASLCLNGNLPVASSQCTTAEPTSTQPCNTQTCPATCSSGNCGCPQSCGYQSGGLMALDCSQCRCPTYRSGQWCQYAYVDITIGIMIPPMNATFFGSFVNDISASIRFASSRISVVGVATYYSDERLSVTFRVLSSALTTTYNVTNQQAELSTMVTLLKLLLSGQTVPVTTNATANCQQGCMAGSNNYNPLFAGQITSYIDPNVFSVEGLSTSGALSNSVISVVWLLALALFVFFSSSAP